MKEQRKFIRFDISLKVNYITQKEPKIEKTGITKDACVGGVQLSTEEKLSIGNKLDMKIFVPNALNPVHMKGVVVWVKETLPTKGMSYIHGIEFRDIEEDNKNTFLRFLCDLMYRKIGNYKT